MRRSWSLVSAILVVTIGPLEAGDIPSGPDAGSPLRPCPVAVIVGGQEGQTLDITADRGGKPTVFLFVQADRFDRPTARFIRAIDQALGAGIDDAPKAASVAIWLTDTPEKSREYLPRAQQSLKLEKTTWSIFDGPSRGPDGWSINDAATLTAVVVRGGKVVQSFGYQSLGEVEPREVLQTLKKPAT
jgi:hypothetical protein